MDNLSEYFTNFTEESPVKDCPYKKIRLDDSNDTAELTTNIENDQEMNSNSGGNNEASHSGRNLDEFEEENEGDEEEEDYEDGEN
jgi:hypothetical protein